MDAIEFINNYPGYLEEIKNVIRPELFIVLDEFIQTDPHDLVTPETWFADENQAKGYIWSLLVKKIKNLNFQPYKRNENTNYPSCGHFNYIFNRDL